MRSAKGSDKGVYAVPWLLVRDNSANLRLFLYKEHFLV